MFVVHELQELYQKEDRMDLLASVASHQLETAFGYGRDGSCRKCRAICVLPVKRSSDTAVILLFLGRAAGSRGALCVATLNCGRPCCCLRQDTPTPKGFAHLYPKCCTYIDHVMPRGLDADKRPCYGRSTMDLRQQGGCGEGWSLISIVLVMQ